MMKINKRFIFFFILIIGLLFFYYNKVLWRNPITTGTINLLDYDIDNTGVVDVTNKIEYIMNKAVKENKKLIIPEGTYLVNKLYIPSNTYIYCMENSLFKLVDNAGIWSRCINIVDSRNIVIEGVLSIDANAFNQSDTNEHMHGLFIYNSKNIYIENIDSYNAVADNVSISGGSDNKNDYSYNIIIDKIHANTGGRKNLVIEHVTKLKIKEAILDNTKGGTDWKGGNSLDVEPFDYSGKVKMINTIDYLETVGCGNDFTAGTDAKSNNYIVNIDTFVADVRDLPCIVDENSQYNKSAIFSYGITLNIKIMNVKLATSTTSLPDSSKTVGANVFNLCHLSNVNIKELNVVGGVEGEPIFIAQNGYTHNPKINVDKLIVNGINTTLDEFIDEKYIIGVK